MENIFLWSILWLSGPPPHSRWEANHARLSHASLLYEKANENRELREWVECTRGVIGRERLRLPREIQVACISWLVHVYACEQVRTYKSISHYFLHLQRIDVPLTFRRWINNQMRYSLTSDADSAKRTKRVVGCPFALARGEEEVLCKRVTDILPAGLGLFPLLLFRKRRHVQASNNFCENCILLHSQNISQFPHLAWEQLNSICQVLVWRREREDWPLLHYIEREMSWYRISILHSGASTQSWCFVLFSYGSSSYEMGCTIAAVLFNRTAEHFFTKYHNRRDATPCATVSRELIVVKSGGKPPHLHCHCTDNKKPRWQDEARHRIVVAFLLSGIAQKVMLPRDERECALLPAPWSEKPRCFQRRGGPYKDNFPSERSWKIYVARKTRNRSSWQRFRATLRLKQNTIQTRWDETTGDLPDIILDRVGDGEWDSFTPRQSRNRSQRS